MCTTLIIGRDQTSDGSMIVARSEDLCSRDAIHIEIQEPTEQGPERFVAREGGFSCRLPKRRLGYSALPGAGQDGEWGAAGFNSVGVGMTSTETIFANEKALRLDPLVSNGLAENSVYNIVLPYVHTAKEGVERLGKMIETYGCAEGFGVGFVDQEEIWYLESIAGHRFIAWRVMDDVYFASANQSRLRQFQPEKESCIASSDLMRFACQHGLWSSSRKDAFDVCKAYGRDALVDKTYNYPRLYEIQKRLSPSVKNNINRNHFPVFAHADRPITMEQVKSIFRNHYDGTEYDPYGKTSAVLYRPISIYRTTQTHVLVVRPWLPKEIGRMMYLALGMADLGVFVPIYHGVRSFPSEYRISEKERSASSAYWRMRRVQSLAMTNYALCAPVVKDAYARLEREIDARQREMEEDYLRIAHSDAQKGFETLRRFSDEMLRRVLEVTDDLTERLFMMVSDETERKYLFRGA